MREVEGESAAKAKPPPSVRDTLVEGVIVTIIVGVLCSTALDGGWLGRFFSYALVVYVPGVALVLFRAVRTKATTLGTMDAIGVRFGAPMLMCLLMVVNTLRGGG